MPSASSNKLFKKLKFYQGDYPLPQELELMAEAERRLSLMLKARWLFLLFLGCYEFSIILSLEGGLLAKITGPFFVPVAGFILMVTYNIWYQGCYRQFSHVRGLRYAEIIFDMIFALLVIHYTGGPLSWAWLVYPLIVVEAAVLLDKKAAVWVMVFLSSLLYGLLLVIEAYMPRLVVQIPFMEWMLQDTLTSSLLFWLRFTLIVVLFAVVSGYLMGVIRKDEAKLKANIVTDTLTGLYNDAHFLRRLNSEISRAKRYKQPLSLLIIGVKDFKEFNQRFGYLEGGQLLQSIAAVLKRQVRRSDTDPPYDVDIACRYGGDKFAIILPNTPVESAHVPAERLKKAVRDKCRDGLSEELRAKIDKNPFDIGIEVGISAFPSSGNDYQQVLKAAERSLEQSRR